MTVAPENLEMSERMSSSWSGEVFVIAALIWLIPDRRIEKRLVIYRELVIGSIETTLDWSL